MNGYLVVVRGVLSGKNKSGLYDKATGEIDDVISYAGFELFKGEVNEEYLEFNVCKIDLPRENKNVRKYMVDGDYNKLIKVEGLVEM